MFNTSGIAIFFALFIVASPAIAQYSRPGVTQPPKQSPIAPSQKQTVSTPTKSSSGHEINNNASSPYCFEVIDQREVNLMQALNKFGLACATVTRNGLPTRLVATANGELRGEVSGSPTVLHRAR